MTWDPKTRPLQVGLLGLGFMGRTHLGAWRAAHGDLRPVEVAAVCDRDPALRAGELRQSGNLEVGVAGAPAERLFDPGEVRAYAEPAELFADAAVDVVSICTHTDSHVDLAAAALRAGKHVLVEKPVALDAASIEGLAAVAAEAGRVCMPAHCMRFWPGWSDLIRNRDRFGPLRSLTLRRQGGRPDWGDGFYADTARSGGALVDLHIHDADMVRALLGDPRAVFSTGDRDHVSTAYLFDDGPVHVAAEGGWDHGDGFAFRMAYTAVFADATFDYDSTRAEPLIWTRDGETKPWWPDGAPESTGYDGEVRHLVDVLAGRLEPAVTLADAAALARLLDAEARSLETGAPVILGAAP